MQTFVGFANGRYIFSSTDGFLNYTENRNYVECSNGSTSQTGTCPAGSAVTGPVLLYLQQAGVGGLIGRRGGDAVHSAERVRRCSSRTSGSRPAT